jgi:uncharacterized OB-fold protein
MSLNVARHWRQRGARYRLEGQRNRLTGELRFPAQPLALGEAPDAWETVALSGRGEIYSFSVIRQAPEGYEDLAPYPVAIVRLAEGPLVTAQLTDCSEEELAIGQPVELATRRLVDTGEDGVLVYGYKFRPVLG